MTTVPAVVIGAGHAGLAVSHVLGPAGIEHRALERGSLAQRWRSRPWQSPRLLTPNWMTRNSTFIGGVRHHALLERST